MNNKKIKIDINNNNDKYVKFNLEQDVESYNLLTLNLSQKEIYQSFNADFGVLMGRVNANGSVGIPNVKISIFIPITDEDKLNEDIFQYYPFEKPTDKNTEGKRYNLLPRVGRKDDITNQFKPKQPFGSFPLKEEVITNNTILEVYNKYYKYSTVTNDSGDYMIFGVPIGVQTVHMSVDITDIGKYSMTPSTMVKALGYSENLFTNNNTLIKPSIDLDDLPHIETQEISVDIIPFWGDNEIFEIGITRQDFKIKAKLLENFVIFGTTYTGAEAGIWGRGSERESGEYDDFQIFKMDNNPNVYKNLVFDNYRIGTPKIKLFSYNINLSDEEIEDVNNIEINEDVFLVDESNYSIFLRKGDFALSVPCNRRKVIINDNGEEEEVDVDYPDGIFTEFKGYIHVEYDDNSETPMINPTGGNALRCKIKIPQETYVTSDSNNIETKKWVKKYSTFKGSEYYCVSMFNHIQLRGHREDRCNPEDNSTVNNIVLDNEQNFGILLNEYIGHDQELNNSGLLPNGVDDSGNDAFGGEWLNMALHLPQFNEDKVEGGLFEYDCGWYFTNAVAYDPRDLTMALGNDVNIGGTEKDTSLFIRGDFYKTKFINVLKEDFENLKNITDKGLRKNNTGIGVNFNSEFMVGGKIDGIPTGADETNPYIYKGLHNANCIDYLYEMNLV